MVSPLTFVVVGVSEQSVQVHDQTGQDQHAGQEVHHGTITPDPSQSTLVTVWSRGKGIGGTYENLS
jgi:hypothetical protein